MGCRGVSVAGVSWAVWGLEVYGVHGLGLRAGLEAKNVWSHWVWGFG